jgi:SPP1 family predicted phage head-tail adaptor
MPKPLAAGRLRHWIDIEAPTQSQNPETGEISTTWAKVARNVPCAIEALSARDYIAAQSIKRGVSVRIIIRYRPGMKTDMRLIGSDGTTYTPIAFLPDANSGREYLTVPCSC